MTAKRTGYHASRFCFGYTWLMERRRTMEWMKGLQKAIDYIEEHLDEEIDYTEIARQA